MKIDTNLGLMVEGVVELDPMTGRLVIRYEDITGANQFVDVEERLRQYQGDAVRCIITPTASINHLARLVEEGQMRLQDVPTVPKLG